MFSPKFFLLINLISIFFSISLMGQTKTQDFKIAFPENKIINALYNSIEVLDIRDDTVGYGLVQKGGLNRTMLIVPETPFATQLNTLINKHSEGLAAKNSMLLLLRKCNFLEKTNSLETGYFNFRAGLYTQKDKSYHLIEFIDTIAITTSAFDVTAKMLKMGGAVVSDFILRNLLNRSQESGQAFSLAQFPLIDSLEKSKMALFLATTYPDGVYNNYESLQQLLPDITEITANFSKNEKIELVTYTNKKGKQNRISPTSVYAIVYQGRLYISTRKNFYPLSKINNDFYFTGRVDDADGKDVAIASAMFGLLGSLLASSATSEYKIKVDHITGRFNIIEKTKD